MAGPLAVIAPDQPVWRVSVKRYHDMIKAGILGSGDRVELLNGVIVPKMAKSPPHSFVTKAIAEAVAPLLVGWHYRSQEPIPLSTSEPEPDIAIVRGTPREYAARHPRAGDISIVVEVCNSTQYRDKITKKGIYSRAKIPVYWIADIDHRHFEIHRRPDGKGDYRSVEILASGQRLPVEIEGETIGHIAVADLLP